MSSLLSDNYIKVKRKVSCSHYFLPILFPHIILAPKSSDATVKHFLSADGPILIPSFVVSS